MAKKITYKEAYAQLESIVQELEDNKLDIDVLSDKIKQSAKLIKICKDKLRDVEEEIAQEKA